MLRCLVFVLSVDAQIQIWTDLLVMALLLYALNNTSSICFLVIYSGLVKSN